MEIISDNQTSFRSTDKELQELVRRIDFDKIQKQSEAGFKQSEEGIKWTFITSNAPHMGGQWESAVKSAKRAMNIVYSDAELYYDELITCTTNAERLLNSRPICPASSDPTQSPPLTPLHFILGQNGGSLAPAEHESDKKLLPRWRHLNKVQSHFWSRWQTELLSHLHPTRKWTEERRNIQAGDLVAEIDKDAPRNQWKIAVVNKVFKSSDEKVRSVTLRYKDGSKDKNRPITKLLLLHPN